MVVVDKILKLGGFLDTALVQRLGFARKTLPPDTPHDETRQRYAVINGQKVKSDLHADPAAKREERQELLEKEDKESERCDLARTLATLAEKHNDFTAADAVLKTMRTDKSVEVRRTAAAYLAFSTKRPRAPISMHVVRGMYDALDDSDQTIRFYAAESVNGSIREADGMAIDQSIQPQVKGPLGRMTSMVNRDFAWAQTRDFVQCIRNRKLNEALLCALTHHTLSVRMATWEAITLICKKDCLKETREVEAKYHKAFLAVKKKKKHRATLCRQREKMEEQLKEEGRETVRIQMEEKAANDGIELDDDVAETLRNQMLDVILGDSAEFMQLLIVEDKACQDIDLAELELQQTTAAYQHLNNKAEELLISVLITVRQEGSKPVQLVNERLGYIQRGNWYIRRAIVQCLFPLAHAGDPRALAIISQSLEDPSPYVQRAAQRELGSIRKKKLDKQKAEAVQRQRIQQQEALGMNPTHKHVQEQPASPIWPASPHANGLQWGDVTSKEAEGGAETRQITSFTSKDGKGATFDGSSMRQDSRSFVADEAPDWLQKEEVSNDLSSLLLQYDKQATAEDERKRKKQKKAVSHLKKEAERIRLLDMAENSTEDVVAFLFKLRDECDAKLIDNVCARFRAEGTTGATIAQWREAEWKNVGFSLNKHRAVLMKALRDMQEQHFQATDPGALAEAAALAREEAAIELAKESAELEREKAKIKLASEARMRAARRGDNEFGGSSGLNCVIFRDSQGQLYLQSVKPCGGVVNEGDTLLKVGEKEVTGMTLLEVRDLLREHGQMCPCLVRLSSQKERIAQIKRDRAEAEQRKAAGGGAMVVKAKKKTKKDAKGGFGLGRFGFGKKKQEAQESEEEEEESYEEGGRPSEAFDAPLPPGDLLRSVQISHVPVAFKDQYLESIGLDVEVFGGDATRSLQVITLLMRNGFGDYINRILVELGIKQLKDLAQQFCYPEWIASVGMTRYEEKKFATLLKRLAVRFKLSDPRSAVTSDERRPNAHETWRFVQMRANKSGRKVASRYRKTDKTISLEGFEERGSTAVDLHFDFQGLDYTILWHEALNIYVELMHTSTGPFRIMRKSENTNEFVPLDPSQPDVGVFTVFGDGTLEAARDLRAPELLKEVIRVRGGGIPYTFPPDPREEMERRNAVPKSQDGSTKRFRGQRGSAFGSSRRFDRTATSGSASTDADGIGTPKAMGMYVAREKSVGGILKESSTLMFDDSSWSGFQDSMLLHQKLKKTSVLFSEQEESATFVVGTGFGITTFIDSVLGKKKDRQVAEDEEIEDDEDAVIGFHVQPEVGMRVTFRPKIAEMHPDLLEDSKGGGGTITWVDDDDADGDGFVGDICEVRWDTGYVGDYKTGYEGAYRLILEGGAQGEDKTKSKAGGKVRIQSPDDIYKDSDEKVVGLDVVPLEGMRVVVRKIAIAENPDLLLDSGGGQGTITWVDPDDADGDGITGDICEVEWDHSGERKDYRTGFESCFRLAQYVPPESKRKESVATADLLRTATASTATTDDRPNSGPTKAKKKRRRGPRTRDEGREPPPDNPWEALEEALRIAKEIETGASDSVERRKDLTRLEEEGKHAELDAGNFHLMTEPHSGFGSSIRVSFSSGVKGGNAKAREDALKLGLRYGGTERKSFVEGTAKKCGFGEDKATELHLTGDGLICFVQGGEEAVVIAEEGLRFVTRVEGDLLLEGVPASMVEEVIQARTNAINVMSDSEPSSQDSSRPVSGKSGRTRPSSRRSRANEARPTTPGTDRPYSASRPSTKGSVRHLLNVDDVSMGTQELQIIEGRAHCLMDDEHALRVSHAEQGNLLFATTQPARDAVPPQG